MPTRFFHNFTMHSNGGVAVMYGNGAFFPVTIYVMEEMTRPLLLLLISRWTALLRYMVIYTAIRHAVGKAALSPCYCATGKACGGRMSCCPHTSPIFSTLHYALKAKCQPTCVKGQQSL